MLGAGEAVRDTARDAARDAPLDAAGDIRAGVAYGETVREPTSTNVGPETRLTSLPTKTFDLNFFNPCSGTFDLELASIDLVCSTSRSSTHWATGNRCRREYALMRARVS